MIPIFANLIWPAMFLAQGMVAFWPILAGLVVEFFFVRYATSLRGMMSVWGVLAMNFASTVLGILLLPISGIVWELIATYTINRWLGGTFNPVTWGVTVFLAAFLNACIESLVLRHAFARTLDRRRFWLLFLANLVSVAIALFTLKAS